MNGKLAAFQCAISSTVTHCSINMKFNEKLNSLLLNKASAALQNKSVHELEESVYVLYKGSRWLKK